MPGSALGRVRRQTVQQRSSPRLTVRLRRLPPSPAQPMISSGSRQWATNWRTVRRLDSSRSTPLRRPDPATLLLLQRWGANRASRPRFTAAARERGEEWPWRALTSTASRARAQGDETRSAPIPFLIAHRVLAPLRHLQSVAKPAALLVFIPASGDTSAPDMRRHRGPAILLTELLFWADQTNRLSRERRGSPAGAIGRAMSGRE